MNKKSAKRRQQWFAIGIAALLIGTFVISLVSAGGGHSLFPTDTPDFLDNPDLPQTASIEPAMQGIAGGNPYLHPTGLYQIFQPNPNTNWGLDPQAAKVADTRAITIYRGNCSVIYTYVDYGINFDTLEAVNENVFTSTYDAAEWALYEYDETDRTVDDSYIVVDYDLVRRETEDTQNDTCPENYKGRQISWLDDGLLYAVRLVVREDDRTALDGLQEIILPTFATYPNITELIVDSTVREQTGRIHPDPNSPIEQRWTNENSFIILPPDWRTDSNEVAFQAYDGFGTMDGYRVTLRSFTDTPIETLEDVEIWISSLRLGVEFNSNQVVDNQRFATGYIVSYKFENADGDVFSAVASVLNDTDGTLHIAELTANQSGLDLLAEPENATVSSAQDIIRSFTITPSDGYVYAP